MRVRDTLAMGGEIVLVVALVALLLGQLVGQPILLGFVESGSMEPTIDEGDGYIALPSPVMGQVEEGDVIVFEAQELHDGGQTTHRVVDSTERGYITRGDANPFTDQDGDEPPVHEEQIVAEALQINGQVVTIPHLGTAAGFVRESIASIQRTVASTLGTTAILGVQGLLNLVVVGCIVLYGLLAVRGNRGRSRSRDRTRDTGWNAHRLVVGFTVLLVVVATVAMMAPTGTHQITVEAADTPTSEGLQPGEAETVSVDVPNTALIPAYVIFEPRTDGIETDPSSLYIGGQEYAAIEMTGTAAEDGGRVHRLVAEYRYLAVLPSSVIHTAHTFHPWAALAAINTAIAVPFYLLGITLIGTGRVRTRPQRDVPLRTRFRRTIRKWY